METTEIVSEIHATATSKAVWTIKGWDGPLQKLTRSQAHCIINVNGVDLRFHLQHFERLDNPDNNTLLPNCKISEKCSGYSLVLDVLTELDEKLILLVEAEGLLRQRTGEIGFMRKNDVVTVEPNSPTKNITAIKFFYRSKGWSEDQQGNTFDYKFDDLDENKIQLNSPSDIKFLLKITTYKTKNTITTNGSNSQNCSTTEVSTAGFTRDLNIFRNSPDNFSDVLLKSRDGTEIQAHRFILAARSPYFRKLFEQSVDVSSRLVSVNLDAKCLTSLVHWIYSGEITVDNVQYLEEMLEVATRFEIPCLLEDLEKKLMSHCNPETMFALAQIAKTYKLNRIQADVSDYITRHYFRDSWNNAKFSSATNFSLTHTENPCVPPTVSTYLLGIPASAPPGDWVTQLPLAGQIKPEKTVRKEAKPQWAPNSFDYGLRNFSNDQLFHTFPPILQNSENLPTEDAYWQYRFEFKAIRDGQCIYDPQNEDHTKN